MNNRLSKTIAIFLTFCVAFSGLPFLAGNLEVNALAKKKKLPKNITLQAAVSGQTQAVLKWNKIKSPSKGYAVFRDGQAVAHFNTKKIAFTDNNLEAGTSYTYQIKTYTKKTVKMWFNKKTEKWQKKKPAKKYRGKSRKEAVYTYKKKSNAVTIHTASAPAPSTPTDTGDKDNTGNSDSTDGNSSNDNNGSGSNSGNDNTGNNNGSGSNDNTGNTGTNIADGNTDATQNTNDTNAGTNGGADEAIAFTVVGPSEINEGKTYEYTIAEPTPEGIQLSWHAAPDYLIDVEVFNDDRSVRLCVPKGSSLKRATITVFYKGPDGAEISCGDMLISIVADPDKEGYSIGKAKETPTHIDSYEAPDASGNSTMTYTFYTNGGTNWTKKNYDIAVEDVTPEAYKEAFSQLGCSGGLKYHVDYKAYTFRLENEAVDGEVTYGGSRYNYEDGTKATITIEAGPAVRVVKVYDKNGHAFDDYWEYGYYFDDTSDKTLYISPRDYERGSDGYDSVYPFYEELYSKARRSIEKQLWTDPNMTTVEKLLEIEHYINTTAHYPYTDATDKEKNPDFWNKWAYDGVALYYDSFNRPYVNKIMKLHGGITTCVAASVLRDVAMEDLGLEYIYDSENNVVLDKEGVWIGMGEYSSNPSAPAHESCIYKDANGDRTYLDAQGMDSTCAEHDCESKILDFSKGLN
ncbi:MAG: hypothetical protein IKM63_04185 [Firmicutes bacterium]|nr:hypothetical protein [Bacillota bacterium]